MTDIAPEKPLAYVLDEHHRGLLWRYVQRHNLRSAFHPLDVMRVGDVPDLPLSATDPAILLWAEREKRILVSQDQATLSRHLSNHVSSGRTSPGIFLTRNVPLSDIVDFLTCAAYSSNADEWENRVTFIP